MRAPVRQRGSRGGDGFSSRCKERRRWVFLWAAVIRGGQGQNEVHVERHFCSGYVCYFHGLVKGSLSVVTERNVPCKMFVVLNSCIPISFVI